MVHRIRATNTASARLSQAFFAHTTHTQAADEVANSAEAMLTLTATSSESSLQRVLKVLTDSGTSCTTKRASPSSCRLIDDGHGRKKKGEHRWIMTNMWPRKKRFHSMLLESSLIRVTLAIRVF